MNKIAIFCTALLIGGFVIVRFGDSMFDLGPVSNLENDRTVHERYISYQCFKYTLDETLNELTKGHITLAEGHARVLEAARRYSPDYLENLKLAEPGRTVEERLAHNLVGHIQSTEEVAPNPDSRLPMLNAELCDFLANFPR